MLPRPMRPSGAACKLAEEAALLILCQTRCNSTEIYMFDAFLIFFQVLHEVGTGLQCQIQGVCLEEPLHTGKFICSSSLLLI